MAPTRQIPLTTDGRKHYKRHKEEIDEAISRVLEDGEYVLGPEVDAFETEFAEYCGTNYAVGTTSGTSALLLTLMTAGIGSGDEVIAVANADISMSTTPIMLGATVKWVDIERDTMNMSPMELEKSISEKTKAVIVAHMYGLPATMEEIQEILSPYPQVTLIEDAALAPGAEYHEQKVGSFGDFGCFSLAAGKVLGLVGTGGIITTNSQENYLQLKELRHYGRNKTLEDHSSRGEQLLVRLGLHERLDAIQGAVGRVKLRHLEEDLCVRRSIAGIYDNILAETPCRTPYVPEGSKHSYRVYVIQVDSAIRDQFVDMMGQKGIETGTHYVPPDHLQPYFRDKGYGRGLLPVTESVADGLVCLPSHPYLEPEDIWYVAKTARETLLSLANSS